VENKKEYLDNALRILEELYEGWQAAFEQLRKQSLDSAMIGETKQRTAGPNSTNSIVAERYPTKIGNISIVA
jgi:hypothetical protein